MLTNNLSLWSEWISMDVLAQSECWWLKPEALDSTPSGGTFLLCPVVLPFHRSMDSGGPDCVWLDTISIGLWTISESRLSGLPPLWFHLWSLLDSTWVCLDCLTHKYSFNDNVPQWRQCIHFHLAYLMCVMDAPTVLSCAVIDCSHCHCPWPLAWMRG